MFLAFTFLASLLVSYFFLSKKPATWEVLPRNKWPKCLRHPVVFGISILCIDPKWKWGKHYAHAHCHPNDPYLGWICFASRRHVRNKTTCLHELAHMLTGFEKRAHGPKWQAAFRRLMGSSWYMRLMVWWDLIGNEE